MKIDHLLIEKRENGLKTLGCEKDILLMGSIALHRCKAIE